MDRLCTLSLLGLALLLAGCRSDSGEVTQEEEAAMAILLTSSAFGEGESIPRKYTCDGEDLSPPLGWSGVPGEAKSLALIVDDPDAPGGTFVHWVLFDLSVDVKELPEGIKGVGVEGVNDFRRRGYSGPCPPRGSGHRYFFKIYALDGKLNLAAGASKRDVERAMLGHILAQGQLTGRYRR